MVLLFCSCVLWLSYGYLREDATILLVNVTGLVLNAVYVVVFLMYTQKMVSTNRLTASYNVY